jgi:vacuolar-type H+-ATPase subunit I/STV1
MLIDNLAKLGSSTRRATSAALIVIAAIAMYNWMVTPQAAYLSSAKGYESVMDKIAEQGKSIASRVEIKKKLLEKLRENSAQLKSVLFTSDQAEEFFSDLQVIAEQTGCAVHTINRIADKRNSENERLGVVTRSAELSVIGNYRDMVKLIERLQNRTEKVWIDQIGVQILDSDSDKARCGLTITICQIIDKDTL